MESQLRNLQSSKDAVIYFLEHEYQWLIEELAHNHKLYLEKLESKFKINFVELKNETLDGKKPGLAAFTKECRKSKFASVAIPYFDLKRLLYSLQNNELEGFYGGDILVQMWRITLDNFYRVSKVLLASITKLWGICKKFISQKKDPVIFVI
jgi:hypothetical protein